MGTERFREIPGQDELAVVDNAVAGSEWRMAVWLGAAVLLVLIAGCLVGAVAAGVEYFLD